MVNDLQHGLARGRGRFLASGDTTGDAKSAAKGAAEGWFVSQVAGVTWSRCEPVEARAPPAWLLDLLTVTPARIDATASWGVRPEGCSPSAEPRLEPFLDLVGHGIYPALLLPLLAVEKHALD